MKEPSCRNESYIPFIVSKCEQFHERNQVGNAGGDRSWEVGIVESGGSWPCILTTKRGKDKRWRLK